MICVLHATRGVCRRYRRPAMRWVRRWAGLIYVSCESLRLPSTSRGVVGETARGSAGWLYTSAWRVRGGRQATARSHRAVGPSHEPPPSKEPRATSMLQPSAKTGHHPSYRMDRGCKTQRTSANRCRVDMRLMRGPDGPSKVQYYSVRNVHHRSYSMERGCKTQSKTRDSVLAVLA